MTKALKMINICMYIVLGKGQWETGYFKMFQGRRDTCLPFGNDFFLWESDLLSSGKRDMRIGTRYPLGFGPLIFWDTSSS